jgi:CO dehydrogenase nickel-insertion accessory protein CooC1
MHISVLDSSKRNLGTIEEIKKLFNECQPQKIERFIEKQKQIQETHSTKHQSNEQTSRLNAVFSP